MRGKGRDDRSGGFVEEVSTDPVSGTVINAVGRQVDPVPPLHRRNRVLAGNNLYVTAEPIRTRKFPMRCIRWKMFDNPNCGPMRLWLAATQSGWQANSQREPAIMAAASPRIQDIFNAELQ